MEILAFFITIIIGVFTEGIGARRNLPGLGTIVAVAFMGALVLWVIRHKE